MVFFPAKLASWTELELCTALKITCLIEQFYRHCSDTAIVLNEVNFILSAGFNNENNFKVTLKFTLAKVSLTKPKFKFKL